MMTSERLQEIERMAEAGNPFAREFIDGIKALMEGEDDNFYEWCSRVALQPNEILNDLVFVDKSVGVGVEPASLDGGVSGLPSAKFGGPGK